MTDRPCVLIMRDDDEPYQRIDRMFRSPIITMNRTHVMLYGFLYPGPRM